MTVQTLVVTTKQSDFALIDKMNIQTDAIIGNQCDKNEITEFCHKGKNILWLSLKEKGVGLNRNNVLMRSSADVCVFADDDMVFHDGYQNVVIELFDKYPKADILIFNLDEEIPKRHKNKKVLRINKSNYGRYGAARIAVRSRSIHMAGIYFNVLFGGGTTYSCGEDSIFLLDCLQKKMRVFAVPVSIAKMVENRESTWFLGYNDKYFFDKGVLYRRMYGTASFLVAFYNCVRHRNKYSKYGWIKAYYKMIEGIRENN